MEISCQLNRADLLEYMNVINRENPKSPWRQITAYTLTPLTIWFFYFRIVSMTPLKLAVALLCTAIWAAFLCWIRHLKRRYAADWGVARAEQRTLVLDSNGLRAEHISHEILFKWTNVYDIIESDNLVIIRLDKHKGITVPKRAFSGQDHAHQFISTAHAYLNSAHDGTSETIGKDVASTTTELDTTGIQYPTRDVTHESAPAKKHQNAETAIFYEVNRTDYLESSNTIASEIFRTRRTLMFTYASVPLLIWFGYSQAKSVAPIGFAFALMLTALWVAFVHWQSESYPRRIAHIWIGPSAKRALILNRDRLTYQYPSHEFMIDWIKVTGINERKNIFIITLDKLLPIVVPKRAFSGQDHTQHFIETARAYWNAARDGIEPILPEPLAMWPPPPQSS